MATLASFSPHLILHRLIRRPAAPSCLRAAVFSQSNKSFPLLRAAPLFTSSRFIFSSFSSSSHSIPQQQFAIDAALLEDVQTESEGEIDADSASAVAEVSNSEVIKTAPRPPLPPPPPPPSLSVKEKKELASFAHSLGKKLKSQQVGKSGVTETVIGALIETLEKNELLKLKIHGTCPGEFEDVVKELEESTGSVVVGQIGRTVILYRPSLSKLIAEEKKKQVQRDFLRRQAAFKQSPQETSSGARARTKTSWSW
ncbi:uncharacterized protein LOC131005487 isoform X2 [Salvia miltiorrhiza]|uniref:uncharacterized protein LOC131005487 isoform X2 n=1 Tax=Salvia miltiorrhiza TaxID=226208 RepID=UPI0025AC2A99|nr:uncharacterized protein LOC131005487 isoform X2 [Salvia miltiorrhiza]